MTGRLHRTRLTDDFSTRPIQVQGGEDDVKGGIRGPWGSFEGIRGTKGSFGRVISFGHGRSGYEY